MCLKVNTREALREAIRPSSGTQSSAAFPAYQSEKIRAQAEAKLAHPVLTPPADPVSGWRHPGHTAAAAPQTQWSNCRDAARARTRVTQFGRPSEKKVPRTPRLETLLDRSHVRSVGLRKDISRTRLCGSPRARDARETRMCNVVWNSYLVVVIC